MRDPRSILLDWAAQGRVQDLPQAMELLGLFPSPAAWRRFVDRLLLWLGTLLLALGVIFFFAYNWADLHRFAKFALVQAPLAVTLVAIGRLGLDGPAGRAALLGASLLVGALLALIGQTYQTGADTFELFAAWAALILPWVLLGRFAPLWLLWISLANLAVSFWFQAFPGPLGWLSASQNLIWSLFALNSLAWILWEFFSLRGLAWLEGRWGPRLLATASGVQITVLATFWGVGADRIFLGSGSLASGLILTVWLAWLALVGFVYRRLIWDLFVLAGGVLSLVVVIASFFIKNLAFGNAGGFLMVGLIIIGISAAGCWWLKQVAAEHEA